MVTRYMLRLQPLRAAGTPQQILMSMRDTERGASKDKSKRRMLEAFLLRHGAERKRKSASRALP